VLNIVRPRKRFTNDDVYAFGRELEQLHPDNRHVRINPPAASVLRDAGLLSHVKRSLAFAVIGRARPLRPSLVADTRWAEDSPPTFSHSTWLRQSIWPTWGLFYFFKNAENKSIAEAERCLLCSLAISRMVWR